MMDLLCHRWLNKSPKIDMENIKAKSGSVVFAIRKYWILAWTKPQCWRQGELSFPFPLSNAGALVHRGNTFPPFICFKK